MAGARGPLPRWCADCRRSRTLRDRIATARNLAALIADAPRVVKLLEEAGEAIAKRTGQTWTRYGE